MLSAPPTTMRPQIPRKIARPVDPLAWSHRAAGSQRIVGPPGMTDRKNVPMPSRKTFEIPATQKPIIARTAWTAQVPSRPLNTLRTVDRTTATWRWPNSPPSRRAMRSTTRGGPPSADVERRRDEERERELQDPDADAARGRDEEVLDGYHEGPQLLAQPLWIGGRGLPPLGDAPADKGNSGQPGGRLAQPSGHHAVEPFLDCRHPLGDVHREGGDGHEQDRDQESAASAAASLCRPRTRRRHFS